jgi:hypothetical protein
MILIFSALANSNLSCLRTMAQSPTTTTTSSNLLTYNNSTYGIKIQYPENWQEKPANGFLGTFVLFSPQGVNQTQDQVEQHVAAYQ